MLVMSCGIMAQAQTGALLFNHRQLHTIEVQIPYEHWLDTLNNDYSLNATFPDSFPEIYRPCDVWVDGQAVANCGIRERGNSSNGFNVGRLKKPFKIAFDAFTEQRFDGLKKINLNNFTNDPSLLRESIVYSMHRKAGIPAPRTSYAKLIVNGEYWGLYLVVENVDKTFLRDHFGNGNEDGNLYKTSRSAGATLEWRGDSATDYQPGLKLTTNEDEDDWSGFIRFVDALNHLPDETFADTFPHHFDVESYLKVLAIEKLVRSWDSYWGGGNNFYLYEHPDGRMRWIPWDVNESFQDIKSLSGTTLLDGYLIPTKSFPNRPLTRRIFAVPEWKASYLDGACELMRKNFVIDSIAQDAVLWQNLIRQAYWEDPHKLNMYSEFEGALHSENMEVVKFGESGYALHIRYPGIFPFILSQREWATEQIEKWGRSCTIPKAHSYSMQVFPNPTDDIVNLPLGEDHFEYAEISVIDAAGRRVMYLPWKEYIGETHALDLSALPSGMYLVMMTGGNGNLGVGRVVRE